MTRATNDFDGLRAALEAIRDDIVAGIPAAEAGGTLPEQTTDALRRSGLSALKVPSALGGIEADPLIQLEILESVARIDGATGWCLMIQGGSSGIIGGFLPESAAQQVYTDSIPWTAGAVAPRGRAEPTDGGFVLSGRWQFGSGIRHAEWVVTGGLVSRGRDEGEYRLFVLPRADVEIHDNWQVSGLKGTGSSDYSIHDAFVAEDFSFPADEILGGRPRRGGPLYRLGLPGFVTVEHAGVALGIGRRALDLVTEQARGKERGLVSTSSLAGRGAFQRDLGKAELGLRSARCLAFEVYGNAWDVVSAGDLPSPSLQAEMRGVATYVTEMAAAAASTAYRYAGGAVLFDSNPLQRCFRDIHAASQHFMVSDSSYEALGQLTLGLTDADPMG